MQGLFKNYELQWEKWSTQTLLWIHLRIPVQVNGGVEWEDLPAMIDTGFDGGLVLPLSLRDRIPDPEYKRRRADRIPVQGKRKDNPLYSVDFQILTQNENGVLARSECTRFLEREYGLIGMDFLKKNDGVVAVDGANQLLSFAAYLSDNDDRWGHWQDRCRQIHQIFPDP